MCSRIKSPPSPPLSLKNPESKNAGKRLAQKHLWCHYLSGMSRDTVPLSAEECHITVRCNIYSQTFYPLSSNSYLKYNSDIQNVLYFYCALLPVLRGKKEVSLGASADWIRQKTDQQKQSVASHLHQQVKGRPRLLTQHPELHALCEVHDRHISVLLLSTPSTHQLHHCRFNTRKGPTELNLG